MIRASWWWKWVLAALPICSNAWGQCIDVADVASELPHEVDTAKQTHLSYFYNLKTEQYVVFVSKGQAQSTPYGPFALTRGCAPAKPRWESDEFVLLEAGCGTFCWTVEALATSGEAKYRQIIRPLAFDEERNLVVSYAEQDRITITNLFTGHEQYIDTARRCQSASELCFDVRLAGDSVIYTWRYGPFDTFAERLDREVLLR